MSATTERGAAALAATREIAPLNPVCFGCGPENADGLQLAFRATREGVAAEWIPSAKWRSFPDVVHGGIVAAALDEAMSKAIAARCARAFTAELRVRYRRPVVPGEEQYIRGWIVSRRKRMIIAEACITALCGQERAHAWGTFLTAADPAG